MNMYECNEKSEVETIKETVPSRETSMKLLEDNRGIGVVELILILVVLIGLVLIFKDRISAIVEAAFTAISGDASTIIN